MTFDRGGDEEYKLHTNGPREQEFDLHEHRKRVNHKARAEGNVKHNVTGLLIRQLGEEYDNPSFREALQKAVDACATDIVKMTQPPERKNGR